MGVFLVYRRHHEKIRKVYINNIMATAWYTLVVGIILSLNGIVFLIFPMDAFLFPNWYLGILLLLGIVGIILGLVGIKKQQKSGLPLESPDPHNQ